MIMIMIMIVNIESQTQRLLPEIQFHVCYEFFLNQDVNSWLRKYQRILLFLHIKNSCDKHMKTAGSPKRLIPNSRKSWQPNLFIFGE